MKKLKMLFSMLMCMVIFCACADNRVYTVYNSQIYYEMPYREANEVLSKDNFVMASGSEITQIILRAQDFLKVGDSITYVSPIVTYEFEDDKLDEISQEYEFTSSLSEDTINEYNLCLASALGVEVQEMEREYREFNGSSLCYSMYTRYVTDCEVVTIMWFNGVVLGDSITISFSSK